MYEDLKTDDLPSEFQEQVQRSLTAAYQKGRADGAAEKTEQFDKQLKPITYQAPMMIPSLAHIEGDAVQTDLPIESLKDLPWLALHFLKRADILTAEQLRLTQVGRLLEIGIDQGAIPYINQALLTAGFSTMSDY